MDGLKIQKRAVIAPLILKITPPAALARLTALSSTVSQLHEYARCTLASSSACATLTNGALSSEATWEREKGNKERVVMPDIQMRFHRDMLVLSSSLCAALARQGVDVEHNLEYTVLFEPETLREVMRMEKAAGAPVVVLPTRNITPAQLLKRNMEDKASELVECALRVARSLCFQHMLVEVAPCGLPLDTSSKSSLTEHKNQYVRVARAIDNQEFDAYFLNNFRSVVELKCALVGLRQVTSRPIFACVQVNAQGNVIAQNAAAQNSVTQGTIEEAAQVMQDFEASVAGFSTLAPLENACAITKRLAQSCDLPLLAQLEVAKPDSKQLHPTPENPYYCAADMVDISLSLRNEQVQFLRATRNATPAYTAALYTLMSHADVKLT